MSNTIYANFPDAAHAEKALGALLDRGAKQEDLNAFFPADYFSDKDRDTNDVEKATSGVTTTTGQDAAVGSGKGAGVGFGVGALAALASLMIPGFGLVTGGGALATAMIGLAGATAGGAVAGGVAGFMQDQGTPERIALDSEAALKNGKAVIVVNCPTGDLGEFEVREILSKYHAADYQNYDSTAQGPTARMPMEDRPLTANPPMQR